MSLAVEHDLLVPYAHPSVSAARPLAGALAPRGSWSRRDLARVTAAFTRHAAGQLHRAARFDPLDRWALLLAATEEVEVWLLTWTPGQGTGPHDQGGATGAYTVLYGELTETWRDGLGRTRHAARLPGSGSSWGPERVHAVRNTGALDAVSVHAYAPAVALSRSRAA